MRASQLGSRRWLKPGSTGASRSSANVLFCVSFLFCCSFFICCMQIWQAKGHHRAQTDVTHEHGAGNLEVCWCWCLLFSQSSSWAQLCCHCPANSTALRQQFVSTQVLILGFVSVVPQRVGIPVLPTITLRNGNLLHSFCNIEARVQSLRKAELWVELEILNGPTSWEEPKGLQNFVLESLKLTSQALRNNRESLVDCPLPRPPKQGKTTKANDVSLSFPGTLPAKDYRCFRKSCQKSTNFGALVVHLLTNKWTKSVPKVHQKCTKNVPKFTFYVCFVSLLEKVGTNQPENQHNLTIHARHCIWITFPLSLLGMSHTICLEHVGICGGQNMELHEWKHRTKSTTICCFHTMCISEVEAQEHTEFSHLFHQGIGQDSELREEN